MKLSLNKLSEYFIILAIFVATILNYFLNINFYYIEIMMICLILLIFLMGNKKILVHKANMAWFIAAFVSIISCTYSLNSSSSFRYCILLLFYSFFMLLCSQEGIDRTRILNLMEVFCGIHMVATLFQLLIPNVFYSIVSTFLPSDVLSMNKSFWKFGTYCGLSENPAPNGFFIALFIIIVFNKLIVNEEKKYVWLKILLLIGGCYTLIWTKKRSFLIFVAIVIAISWLIGFRKNQHKLKYLVISICLIVLGIYFIERYNLDVLIVEKFLRYMDQGDISNGRMELWEESLDYFQNHPLFGVGIRSLTTVLGNDSHNIYIQLLAEVGIIGAFIFYVAIWYPIILCIKQAIKMKNRKMDVFVVISIQILFVLYGITGNDLFDHRFMWMYAVAMGLGIAIVRERKNDNE